MPSRTSSLSIPASQAEVSAVVCYPSSSSTASIVSSEPTSSPASKVSTPASSLPCSPEIETRSAIRSGHTKTTRTWRWWKTDRVWSWRPWWQIHRKRRVEAEWWELECGAASSSPSSTNVWPDEDCDKGIVAVSSKEPVPPPKPILCTFDFEDATYAYDLDFDVYRRWRNMETLVEELLDSDGLLHVQLWDEKEGMEIMAGDWEARIRPGWEVRAVCTDYWESCSSYVDKMRCERDEGVEREECEQCGGRDQDRYEDSDSDDEEGEEETGDIELCIGEKREEWSFASWRRRVEVRKQRYVTGTRNYLVGAVGWVVVLGSFWVLMLVSSKP
ncbi:hypothetical protein BU26DRAFT_599179 [Trematosphaeria pertusa]|uniref:Uncharacterized protein n=1 Tax=Trematosphaeria pertusa TaxID=390896 RepID=A0A6A6J276_9PLEO|nr:uncharacterized protein BU26DRAFT_599179 [Trematosphaeria pertusa]KAF2256501.1 hypothetical protein BU26DRAFT_599179 [Trematosphaeria pertusa]